ncbi:hypothetical protein R6Q57_005694 [Mikania cordata]
MVPQIRKPATDPKTLIWLSEQFLRRRHFDDCRKYSHQANQVDPNFPGVSEILAVADVLLASKHQTPTGTVHDYYEALQITRYSQDSDLIKQRFNRLYELLNPSNNKFQFADEAFDIVCDAWYVLSNPVKKLEFDDLLKKLFDDDEQLNFWTVCPYCCYLYEYPRVYLDLCLRCSNEKCCRAFTCVEIDQPPVEVLKVGKYVCAGFVPLGFQNGCWNPFAPLNKPKADPADVTAKFVNISDDDVDDDDANDNGDDNNKQGDEGVHKDAGGLKIEVDVSIKMPNEGRMKSVAKNTKKVTGVGNRMRKQGFVHPEMTDDCVFF